MASVEIDLGAGEQAILSDRAPFGVPSAKCQRDAEEFLRRWPQTRSLDQARGYLQQLGLYMTYRPPGVNPSDMIALLRSAVQSGKVIVVIERAARRGGGSSAPQRSGRRTPIPSSRKSFAEMAAGAGSATGALKAAEPAEKTYSWMQHYDDVSADDLIAYIESVIGKTPDSSAGAATTPLGDAQPFELPESSSLGDAIDTAMGWKEDCFAQWERDEADCNLFARMMGGERGVAMCLAKARLNYNLCMGYTKPI